MIRIIFYITTYLITTVFTFSQVKSKNILIKNDSIELPGTLTYLSKKTPLIIWVHGSGNVDRNGNQGKIIKANYIQKFREAITVNDIAFFSYDKRTSNPKNYKFFKKIVFEDLVNDVEKVIDYFKNDQRFSEIILIGHSQGSLIGMLASKNVDKYISIAGSANTIDKTIIQQVNKQNKQLGDITKSHFEELLNTGNIKQVNPLLISIFAEQNLPFISSWISYNPIKEIKKLTIPTLIINGNKDLQVQVEDAKLLHKSNSITTLNIIDKMNHILIELEKDSDNLKSYYSSEYMISDELIVSILNFINK
ncbi:alpha/beta hydrolase [Tenacibaculum sp. nBUS_03]|uniref:alpha/beta hydrolase n=1 Tax=Tenacibaculum sp. nBUS_03 TaxID=3395320 RepID=UPI003EBB2096